MIVNGSATGSSITTCTAVVGKPTEARPQNKFRLGGVFQQRDMNISSSNLNSAQNNSPASGLWLALLGAAVIIIITIAAYWPALHAGFIWDDDQYVWNNPLLLDSQGLTATWTSARANPQYYPVVFT